MKRASATLLCALFLAAPLAAQDVPLELWTSASWPGGVLVGKTDGVSLGDHDRDGWVDFFSARTGRLWVNIEGQDWQMTTILTPKTRYGSAFGDYDNDGLPDIATEPRGTLLLNLLHNLGGGNFVDVAPDPNIIDVVPSGDSETNCWLDVDFDGNLDLFVPVYPPSMGGPGNFFLYNLGPTGPGGQYRFTEMSGPAGLDNPAGTARPEGAEFCDIDGDGDLDGYSNGTLYQNVSQPGVPLFRDVSDDSDILLRNFLEEGCAFFDHDMDGDFDLALAYCPGKGIRIFENDGDGTFRLISQSFIDAPMNGGCLGLSKADWDNDGDIDFTTTNIFRRNMLVETGKRGYLVANHTIPHGHVNSATPAWFDWDHDGDLDCALGNWMSVGHFYESVLYDSDTPDSERRYVRVRVLRDADSAGDGLETEYGASVELFLENEANPKLRRRSFVSSAGGYINQNEYTLHFGLPPDPDPEDPTADIVFDVQVDFNSDPADGLRRVDRSVNPALGRIHLAELTDREIVVFRSGRVKLNGCIFEPMPGNGAVLTTSTGGLALAAPGSPLPDPTAVPGSDWYVGLAFDTTLASGPLRVKEVIVDGIIAASPASCGGNDVRLTLWDTTDPSQPFVAGSGTAKLVRYPRNDRNHYRVNMVVEPGRQYRMVARVDQLRASLVSAPLVNGPIQVLGGLSFGDATPCEGSDVAVAGVDASQVYLALRLVPDAGPLWVDLGHALAGTGGPASLAGSGVLEAGQQVTLELTGALPTHKTILVTGATARCLPVAGGLLVPSLDSLQVLTTDASGAWSFTTTLPASLPPGTTTYFQAWWADTGAPRGRAASNALSATSPF